jgi:hypothetical protein
MSSPSPTLEGFRAAFRQPSITLAEIAWRWTVGAVAGALLFFGLIEFLDSLTVARGDSTLLRTRLPLLVGRAITHILRGSMNRVVFAALLAIVALSLLWIIAASIGRLATIRGLLDYFRRDTDVDATSGAFNSPPFWSLIELQFFRVAVVLAALLALAGAAILASFASNDRNPHPGLVAIIFLLLAALIGTTWSVLNWILSLAAIFAVRDGDDALAAVSAAVAFFRRFMGPVSAVSTWTGLAHVIAISIAASAVSVPLVFIQIAPARLLLAVAAVVALVYFAVADWLYIARLGGYICIGEMPEALPSSSSLPGFPPQRQSYPPNVPAQNAVDRDELILGDVPNLAVET